MKKLEARYLFGKSALPLDVSSEMSEELARLQKCRTKELYLKEAYNLITTRYESGRVDTVLRIHELFSASTGDLWNRNGFLHCTNQNYLLAVLLVKGGHFRESDIRPKWTLIAYFSPHQYLKIRLDRDTWINVDCWGRHYGVRFGDYARGFNNTLFRAFVQ